MLWEAWYDKWWLIESRLSWFNEWLVTTLCIEACTNYVSLYYLFIISLLVMSNMLSMLSKDETIETMLASAVGLLSEDVIKEVSLNQMNMIDRLLSQLLL